ncbi:MAG: hypothetical protein GX387_03665 [Clostridium sp.]|jgi:hypothetical protein|nr:hypothetical protein [Clostridium sp.]
MEKKKYYSNGFIIKRINGNYAGKFKNYDGIEGDIWPLDKYTENVDLMEFKYIDSYLSEKVFRSDVDKRSVDVCNDVDFLNKYISICEMANFKIEILFCQTERVFPKSEIEPYKQKEDFEFLGYDYGYPGSDYYSCVYNDVKRMFKDSNFTLNKNGLFEDEGSILEYISAREKLKKQTPEYMFEEGEFIIYKLWKYIGEVPIKKL